jgi:ElaB/YqjD/DUF883 family membrane-anchored ribosome-binding protein
MISNTAHRARNMGDLVFNAVKDNPEGLLLLAAGCALLLRSKSSASGASSTRYRSDPMKENSTSVYENVSEAAETARDYVADVAEKVGVTAKSYASSATQFADETRRSVSEKSGRFAEQAQTTARDKFNRVLQDQPLVLVFAGLAAGAAVASALPVTEIEKNAFGPTGEVVADIASKAGERFKDATRKAGEHLKTDAEQRGLTTEGLKEMASEAASAFGGALSGEDKSAAAGAMSSTPNPGVAGGQSSDTNGNARDEFASPSAYTDRKPASNT